MSVSMDLNYVEYVWLCWTIHFGTQYCLLPVELSVTICAEWQESNNTLSHNLLPLQGILQPGMWNVVPSDRWNWSAIRQKISEVGLRNSLLVAPMPTASTSQILGNNECFEPYTSNIYSRRVWRFVRLLLKVFMFSCLAFTINFLYAAVSLS